jgi:hypothetical protein
MDRGSSANGWRYGDGWTVAGRYSSQSSVLYGFHRSQQYLEGRPNCGYRYGTTDLEIKYWSIRVDIVIA